jgi:hypothetical protein
MSKRVWYGLGALERKARIQERILLACIIVALAALACVIATAGCQS